MFHDIGEYAQRQQRGGMKIAALPGILPEHQHHPLIGRLFEIPLQPDRQGMAVGRRQRRLALQQPLKKLRVDLTPLMLLQVDPKDKSVECAKERLMALGFTEAHIAVHTAEEPDSTLLALANDESREVLVFKMAVALGFDAPRAFTLVSMRAARDEDFGVQLVGRILRVHRRLQARARAKSLPSALRYGYVLLADAEAQTGLDLAGQRINKLQTEYAKVSPTTAIVQMGGQAHVQVLGSDGQITLLPVTLPPGFPMPAPGTIISGEVQPRIGGEYPGYTLELLTGGYTPQDLLPDIARHRPPGTPGTRSAHGWRYDLRSDVPNRFKTQVVALDNEVTEEQCAQKFIVSLREILHALVPRCRSRNARWNCSRIRLNSALPMRRWTRTRRRASPTKS